MESSLHIEGLKVGLSVRRLDAADAQRIATSLAWHGSNLLGEPKTAGDDEWPRTLQHILRHYVAFTMDEGAVKKLGEDRLSDAMCAGALAAFIRVNELHGSISRQLAAYLRCRIAAPKFTH